jgi:SNF2 family DNA or RNA helicase
MSATTTIQVNAEVSDDGDRVNITFNYAPERVVKIKKVPSARFVPKEKGGPLWRLDLDLPTMRKLREQFGNELGIGPKLKAWGQGEVTKETKLISMSQADDADLERIPKRMQKGVKLKGMKRKFALRPYQKADIKFMAETNAINANQPGAGKTIETIAATFEAGMEWGRHLVFAPVTSLRTVWEDELLQAYKLAGWDEPVILTGDTPTERKKAIAEAKELADDDCAFWLVLNPAMARMKRVKEGKGDNFKWKEELTCPELGEIDFDSMTIDEFHLMGLSNPQTLTANGVNAIAEMTQPSRRYALSGTPMGGKPIKLWGALHFLNPGEFSSRWNWARHWLVVSSNRYGSSIEGIMPGREVDFYNHLKPYLVRRTKREALPGIPPKQTISVWCTMSANQEAQYRHFATEAEWRIEDAEEGGRLTATNVLAEYTRLKQFASAYCEVSKTGRENHGIPEIQVLPTTDSGKFLQLVEKLKEENVIGVSKEMDEDLKCALVFSQFKPFTYAIAKYLTEEAKVPCGIITGDTKQIVRTALKNSFQEQSLEPLEEIPVRSQTEDIKQLIKDKTPPRVMVMTTQSGGASITLTQADSVHILDETWVPDNQEQAEDRAHRGDDKTMDKDEVRIYYYRTKNSIEEYIQKLVADKQLNNKTVLDLRRRMQKDLEKAEQAKAAGSS